MMETVVTFLLALFGLALTVVGLGIARRTGRDIKENKTSKFETALARLPQSLSSIVFNLPVGGIMVVFGVVQVVVVMDRSPPVTPTRGADQMGYVGQPLPDTVEVMVQTKFGVAAGATVVFAPTSSDHGTAGPATAVADSTGRARTVWTLGDKTGEQHMLASVVGGNSVWIIAKAREQPVPRKIKITPDSAVLRFVGDIAPFTAEILDQHGDPFPGSITWSNNRQCIFRTGSSGFAIARKTGVDSIVAVFDTLRATAPVRVDIGGR